MSQNLTISETGLKLIKAFEGFRPVDRELTTGQRVVGYGHRLYSEDAVMMNKQEALKVLKSDLEPFEDMLNSEVHAPLSQSQFDALCSFAFNIGPKAFLQSDTLRAINNGRPLDAANALDSWRKSVIDGKTYVVDALMRRRTAEKSLFLRTNGVVPAGREDLPPVKDMTISGLSTADNLPVFTQSDANGIVATAPYDAAIMPSRRREDGPAGALQLSELDIIDDDLVVDVSPAKPDLSSPENIVPDIEDGVPSEVEGEILLENEMPRTSPIAAAATEIVARLDALIDDADIQFDDKKEDWPDSLIDSGQDDTQNDALDDTLGNVIDLNTAKSLPAETTKEKPADNEDLKSVVGLDETVQDEAVRKRTDSAAKYIETSLPIEAESEAPKKRSSGLGIPIALGFILVGLAGGAMIRGSELIFGQWGPIISFTGFVIGIGLIVTGVYAVLRMNRIR